MFVATAIAAALGIASHLLWFRHGEHHMLGGRYAQAFFFTFASLMAYLLYIEEQAFSPALAQSAALVAGYLAGVFSSLIVYRIWFSPSAKFPGPLPSMSLTL
jgi:hypothetical protein